MKIKAQKVKFYQSLNLENNFEATLLNSLNGMTIGLFATLIIGTIIQQLGLLCGDNIFGNFLVNPISLTLKSALGLGIGIGVALSLKLDGLKLITAGIIGAIASSFKLQFIGNSEALYKPIIGLNLDPLTIYLVVILGIFILNLLTKKKTPVDILLIPLLGVLIAGILTYLISGPSGFIIYYIARFVDLSTRAVPFLMVILISVVMGMLLTSPISSAAIALIISIGINPVAAAAAMVGTSCQMVGFAVQSRKDNKIGTVIAILIGTSMLQFKNILKKPIIWLPTIITSAVLAPFVLLFKFSFDAEGVIADAWTLGAGMGTSGLVAPVQTFVALGVNSAAPWLFVLLMLIFIPGLLVFGIDFLFRKLNLIKLHDLEVSKL